MEPGIDAEIVSRYENETWSRCAESYADTFQGLTREAMPLLRGAVALRAGERVLDLGSGPGDGTAELAESGMQVTGVDFSEKMTEVARRRHAGIAFHTADAEKLPFEAGAFDVVLANCVVHHLARPDVVFREVARVLAPHGRFAFTVWGAPEHQTGFGVFFGAVQAHHDLAALPQGPLFGVIDPGVFELRLSGVGLERFRFSTHAVSWHTATLDPVLRGLCDWGNIRALPAETQRRIEASARANAKAYQTSHGFVFPHSVLLGLAVKP